AADSVRRHHARLRSPVWRRRSAPAWRRARPAARASVTLGECAKESVGDDRIVSVSLIVNGVVVRGHGVASGSNPSSPFPEGTIAMQVPHFLARGLDLSGLFAATINVDLAPHSFTIRRAAHTFRDVEWTDVHGPETFSFLHCRLLLPAENGP